MQQLNKHHSKKSKTEQHHTIKMEYNGLPAPPPPHIIPQKAKKPHVKKPLNAFMLFMKEQRAQVVSECTLRESAAINQILGRKWHELERPDQAKYYEMARQERLKHMQQHPGWSARDNYGLKKKRRRKREKVIGENGELPRKCRARYGLHQIALWCKPCRRKKKCIRFAGLPEEGGLPHPGGNGGMIMGPNGQMYPSSVFNGDGGIGSGGSLNGLNSEDDYEQFDDEAIDAMEDAEDDDDDDDDEYTDASDDEADQSTTLTTTTPTIKDSTNAQQNAAAAAGQSQLLNGQQNQQHLHSHHHSNNQHSNHSHNHQQQQHHQQNHQQNHHHHNHHQNKKPNLDLNIDTKAGLMHQIRMNEMNQMHHHHQQQQQQQQQQQLFNHLLP
jgi:hypothetical protein